MNDVVIVAATRTAIGSFRVPWPACRPSTSVLP